MSFLVRYLVIVFAILAVAHLVEGIVVENLIAALVAGLILGLLNVLVRPVLLLLTLPITILTLGLFVLVINTLMFWLAAFLVPGFSVSGFLPAFLGALGVSVVSIVANKLIR